MEPKDFARIIAKRKAVVSIGLLVVLMFSMAGSMRASAMYVGSCEVHFGAILANPSDTRSDAIETIGNLNDNVHFIEGPTIAAAAATRAGVPASWMTVNASVVPGTQFLMIRAFDRDAARAARTCDAVASAYVAYKQDAARAFFTGALAGAAREQREQAARYIANQTKLERSERARNQGQVLSLTIDQDLLLNALSASRARARVYEAQLEHLAGGPEVVRHAGLGARLGPNHVRDATLGVIVGLMFGIGLALAAEWKQDRRIRLEPQPGAIEPNCPRCAAPSRAARNIRTIRPLHHRNSQPTH